MSLSVMSPDDALLFLSAYVAVHLVLMFVVGYPLAALIRHLLDRRAAAVGGEA